MSWAHFKTPERTQAGDFIKKKKKLHRDVQFQAFFNSDLSCGAAEDGDWVGREHVWE